MPNLFKLTAKRENIQNLSNGEILSVAYHDIFDFPLNIAEMIRWRAKEGPLKDEPMVDCKNNFYFMEGKNGLIYKRALRKRISERKMEIALKRIKYLKLLPGIKMVGITGSLAMGNSSDESDIDLMIITKKGSLWTTRLICLLGLTGKVRKSGDRNQKDKLCLNIWMDETDLKWRKGRNIYTAHEIAQVVPLVNKDKTYEKFLIENKWILDFWPQSVKIEDFKYKKEKYKNSILETVAYKLQKAHMRSKITREIVTPTRALFHPVDWGKVILDRLNSYFIQ